MRGLLLAVAALGTLALARADDPPKKDLTPEQRKALEVKALDLYDEGEKASKDGKSEAAQKAFAASVAAWKQLHPNGDHVGIANGLTRLAWACEDLGKDADAEKHHREALGMLRRLAEKDAKLAPDVVDSLNDLAFLVAGRGQFAEAEKLYAEALDRLDKLHPKEDNKTVATTLRRLAGVLKEQGKLADAEARARASVEMFTRLHKADHASVATGLADLGGVLAARQKYDDAATAYRDAIDMLKRLYPKQDREELVKRLRALADVLKQQEKFADAEALHRDALAMARRVHKGDHVSLLISLNSLGLVLKDQGKYAAAEPFYREQLEMEKRLSPGDGPFVALSMESLGILVEDLGKLVEAEALLRDALGMRKRLHKNQNHSNVAAGMGTLARVLARRGNLTEAETLFRDALKMSRLLAPEKGSLTVARGLNDVAFVLNARGKLAEAEALYAEALQMLKALDPGDNRHVASAMNNVAVAYLAEGKYADAEPLLRDALAMRKRLHPKQDHPNVAFALNNLGKLLGDLERYADAEKLIREALDVHTRLYKGDHPEVATNLGNLAAALKGLGRDADAEKALRDSLGMRRRLFAGDHADVALSLGSLAAFLSARGQSAEADGLYREALEMRKRLNLDDHPDTAQALSSYATFLSHTGKYADADRLYRESGRMFRALAITHAALGSEGRALNLLAVQPIARDGFLSNARLNNSSAAAAYEEIWASKAHVARVAEGRAAAARAATDPKAAALLAELRDVRRRRAELILTPMPADKPTRDRRDEELAAFARTAQKLEAALRPLLPAVERQSRLAASTPADLQKALPTDAAYVDFLAQWKVTQDPKVPGEAGLKKVRIYTAFILTREGVAWIDLAPADLIDPVVGQWREAITTPPFAAPADLPAKVRERVWAPVRKALPPSVKVVYLAPDAALTGVPWAALPGDKAGSVLLDDFALALAPHGPALLDSLWPPDERTDRPAGFLAVGGVSYGAEPAPAGAGAVTRGDVPTDPKKKLLWGDLAGTKAEVQQTAKRAGEQKLTPRLVTGADASAERVLAELPKARFAHLATHGFFADASFRSVAQTDPKLFETRRDGRERVGAGALYPMVMSGLVFAGANRPATPGRGILTGEALLDTDLSGLELAVLSACETGLGSAAGGEGVFGLQRSFHVAGCRNVVASLWKVDDAATAALMGEFYRQLWELKQSPVEALRRAQLAVMRADPKDFAAMALRGVGKGDKKDPNVPAVGPPLPNGRANPPVFWAAFTLSGPGR